MNLCVVNMNIYALFFMVSLFWFIRSPYCTVVDFLFLRSLQSHLTFEAPKTKLFQCLHPICIDHRLIGDFLSFSCIPDNKEFHSPSQAKDQPVLYCVLQHSVERVSYDNFVTNVFQLD